MTLSRVLLVVSVATFLGGAIAFEWHDAHVQPTGRLVYFAVLPVPLLVYGAMSRLAPRKAGGDLDVPPSGMVAFLVALLGAPLAVFDALVVANAFFDPSPRVPVEHRIADVYTATDSDGDPSFHASLVDPGDAASSFELVVDHPPFPDASSGRLRVAVCPGALGIRWFCQMP